MLVDAVINDSKLKGFADGILAIINKNIKPSLLPESYPKPTNYWKQQSTDADIQSLFMLVRSGLYSEFIENKNNVFNQDNMNKIEAINGTQFKNALEDMFFRM